MPRYDRKDALYRKAKSEGYASRASYKLLELEQKHQIFKGVGKVVDLGCAPGGWLQVAEKLLRRVEPGAVNLVGVDLLSCDPRLVSSFAPSTLVLEGDIYSDEIRAEIAQSIGHADLVLSDMSPNLSGVKFRDAAESANLVESALEFASEVLRPGGAVVCKIFPGHEADELFRTYSSQYKVFKRVSLKSTRSSSKEFYFLGQDKLRNVSKPAT